MSTELKTLTGSIEKPNKKEMKSDYEQTDFHLTRFYGGTERGVSLQLGFYNENGDYSHLQLDNENVLKLIKELQNNF